MPTLSNEELRAKYNPEGSVLRKAQLRMLEILDYVVDICEQHNLQYWLCGGTMLGAIRHKGFIPWDDDLDIEMPKKDYKKLVRILRKSNHPYFEFHDHSTDSNYFALFGKVRDKDSIFHEGGAARYWRKKGCFIDIFAMEKSNRAICNSAFWWNFQIDRMINHGWRIPAIVSYKVYKALLQPIYRFASIFVKKGVLHQPIGKGRNNPRYINDLFPLQDLEFEGKLYKAPYNPDGYLKQIFGANYMVIPEQIFQHTSEIEVFPHEEI